MSRTPGTSLLVLMLLLAGVLLITPPGRAAQLTTFEAVEPPFIEGPFIFRNQDVAQSFVPTEDYRLVRVEVMVHDLDISNPVDLLTLTLRPDGAGVPSATVLASEVADGEFGYNWLGYNLSTPVDLTAGQTYWIVLEDQSLMNQQSGYRWALKGADAYPPGLRMTRGGGGPWNLGGPEDLLFRTWGLRGPAVVSQILADSATAGALDPLTYTVFFNNTGTEPASALWVNLTLSPATTFEWDTAASAGGTSTGPTSWRFSNVGTGDHNFTVGVRVRPDVFDGLRIDATAVVEYADLSGQMQERSEATATVTARRPSMSVAKVASPSSLGPGENVTYTVTFVNSGSRPAMRVWVNDTLPSEVVLVSHTAATLANYSGEWFDGIRLGVNFTLLPQGSYSFDVVAQTLPGLLNGTAFTNRVSLDFTDNRGITVVPGVSASATARIHGASIQVVKLSDVGSAGPGQEVLFTIRYDNRGNAVARRVWINDTLPSEFEYVSDSAGGTVAGPDVRFAFSDVTVGVHFLIITARVRGGVSDGTLVTNRVTLDHTDSDFSPAPPSSAAAFVLVVRPAILLDTAGPPNANPGDVFPLGVLVSNEGNASATSVWVNISLTAGLSRVFDNAGAFGGVATPEGWRFSDVMSGIFQFTIELRVAPGLADRTELNATFASSYVDAMGLVANAIPVSRSVVVTAPALTLASQIDRSAVAVGDTFAVTILYENRGSGVARDVWLNVTLPEGFAVVSASSAWVATTGLQYSWYVRDMATSTEELRLVLRPVTGDDRSVSVFSALTYTDGNGNLAGAESSSVDLRTYVAGWTIQAWGFAILLTLVAALSAFIGYRVYGLGTRDRAQILQLFLLHKSGLLIKHYTRTLHGTLDTDILAAMLVAVQNFVRESFRFKPGDLEEMTFGHHRILLAHGRYTILAALVSGKYLERLKAVLRAGLAGLEDEHEETLRDWSGVIQEFDGLEETLDQILKGKIAPRNGANGKLNGLLRRPSNGL